MEVLMRVEGRVQGVGFRAWTRALATELGVRGWVSNRYDGSVEVHAAGSADVIEEFTRRLYDGPRGASVTRVSVEGPAERLPAAGFAVRL
jgi:acylphosphatase